MADIDNYDAASDSVVMMTMHSAKGLEFPVVFLPGFEEGIFPGVQVIYSPSEIEEERRLAYVAITRAKEELYLVSADSRVIFGSSQRNRPSRFLKEIPEELVEEQPHPLLEKARYGCSAARFFQRVARCFRRIRPQFRHKSGQQKAELGPLPRRRQRVA